MLHPVYRKYLQIYKGAVGVIYMLHRVSEFDESRLYPNENMKVSPSFLEKIIEEYRHQGFDFLSLDEVYTLLSTNKKPLRPFVTFTMDDGYLDNYTNAYPIFKKQQVPFAIYVATDFPDRKALLWWYALEDYLLERKEVRLSTGECISTETQQEKCDAFMYIRSLILKLGKMHFQEQFNQLLMADINLVEYVERMAMSWQQVEELSKDPICMIAGHTISHPAFNTLSEEELRQEVRGGSERLSACLHQDIQHFAYPFGSEVEVEERELELTEQFDFRTITTTRSGVISMDSNPKRLTRFMLSEL